MSEIYHGETYDARLEKAGWTVAGFDDRAWTRGDGRRPPQGRPGRARPGRRCARIQELKPVKIFKTPAGDTVVDMGQNMVGWVRLKVQGPAGTTVTLRHAEVLDKEGNFYTANLREAKATVQYTLKGGGAEIFEPHFTFLGFRYVAVDGFPGELTPDSAHRHRRPLGHGARRATFETSNPLVNQLQHNIVWGQKGNFLDVPTDCPQRDERLGWTGDAQVFAPHRRLQHGRGGLLHQVAGGRGRRPVRRAGACPTSSRTCCRQFDGPRARRVRRAGPTRRSIIPWTMYLAYGDTRVLETAVRRAWRSWVELRAGRAPATTSSGTATSTSATGWPSPTHATQRLPGRDDGQGPHRHRLLRALDGPAARARRSCSARRTTRRGTRTQLERDQGGVPSGSSCTDTGRVGENTQTAYVLALQFDLLPEAMRAPAAAQRLAEDVRDAEAPDHRASSARRTCATCSAATATSTRPTCCSTARSTRRGSTRSRRARPRSGSAGTARSPTARSRTRA